MNWWNHQFISFQSYIINIFSFSLENPTISFRQNDDDFFTDDSGFGSIAIGPGAAPCSTFSCPLLWCFLVEVDMSLELEQMKFVHLSMCIYTKTPVDQAKEEGHTTWVRVDNESTVHILFNQPGPRIWNNASRIMGLCCWLSKVSIETDMWNEQTW